MKRSFDDSFISDSDTTIDRHSFQRHATLATHQTNDYLRNTPTIELYDTPLFKDWGVIVPFDPSIESSNLDFQSNTGHYVDYQPGEAERSVCATVSIFSDGSRAPPSGLGILCEASPAIHTPMVFTPIMSTPQFAQWLRSPSVGTYLSEEGSRTRQLSLQDVFRIASSPVVSTRNNEDYSNVQHDSRSTYMGTAYSAFPELEYMACSPALKDAPAGGSAAGNSTSQDFREHKSPLTVSISASWSLCLINNFAPGSPPFIGLFPDINMRDVSTHDNSPVFGVNPAEITGDCDMDDKVEVPGPTNVDSSANPERQNSELLYPPSELELSTTELSDEAITAIMFVLSGSEAQQEVACEPTPVLSIPPAAILNDITPASNFVVPPPFPTRSVKAATPQPQAFVAPFEATNAILSRPPLATMQPILTQPAPPQPEPQSPILNAHEGISLEHLRRRAEEFRERNPGFDIDKAWLQVFAGRLSQRGELLEDYRCYVVDCHQRNKRRDHILVHVGSHVEHRPFQCNACGMRFLRKNECKRHEASHDGNKPFACPICAPYQDRSFVRQDLLKRHMRVAHGVLPDSAMDRRRKKARQEEGYWP